MENSELRKFLLLGRYGEKRFLKEVEPSVFKLTGEDLEYMRVIFSKDGKSIKAIDPSGGPFIAIDSFILNKKLYVKSITIDNDTQDFLIHTKNYCV